MASEKKKKLLLEIGEPHPELCVGINYVQVLQRSHGQFRFPFFESRSLVTVVPFNCPCHNLGNPF